MMDNFDLHAYLRNNPLFETNEEEVKETKTKMTKEKFKKMVKEMVLAETELDEMARIATYYELTDDYEEAISKMPENKQKSSRYQRVINYLKDNGQGTLKTIADEEFRTSETAAVSPIMSDLVSYGVAQKGDLVSPKQEKPVGDGTRGRKMSDVGRVKSALEKFKAGSSDYTDEERTALQNFIDSISATLKEGLNENDSQGLTNAASVIDYYLNMAYEKGTKGESLPDNMPYSLIDNLKEFSDELKEGLNENEGIKIKFLKSKQWDALQDKYEETGRISPNEEYLADAGTWNMEGYFNKTYPSLEAFSEFITKKDGGNAQNWLKRLNKTKDMGIISIN
jgi:hypothetical protein